MLLGTADPVNSVQIYEAWVGLLGLKCFPIEFEPCNGLPEMTKSTSATSTYKGKYKYSIIEHFVQSKPRLYMICKGQFPIIQPSGLQCTLQPL
jgi:hypothetical protein